MKYQRLALLLAGIEIGVVGAIYLFAPRFMVESNGMKIITVSDFHSVRAAYGGAFVGFAALFLYGALREHIRHAALVSLAVLMTAFACGRIFSLLVDGIPAKAYLGALASEVVFAAAAFWLLRQGPGEENAAALTSSP